MAVLIKEVINPVGQPLEHPVTVLTMDTTETASTASPKLNLLLTPTVLDGPVKFCHLLGVIISTQAKTTNTEGSSDNVVIITVTTIVKVISLRQLWSMFKPDLR